MRNAGCAGLEDGVGEGRGDRQGAQNSLQGRAEVAFGEGQYLAEDLADASWDVVCLDDGTPGGLEKGAKRWRLRHVFGPLPGEGRRELDQARGARGDRS